LVAKGVTEMANTGSTQQQLCEQEWGGRQDWNSINWMTAAATVHGDSAAMKRETTMWASACDGPQHDAGDETDE
jgi:hypothetical protein